MNSMIKKAFVLGLMLILVAGMVCATPGIPHQFYGTVTLNGNPAPDGTKITATVDGVKAEEEVATDGKYGYEFPKFKVEDPNNDRAGKTIKFYINGKFTGTTAIFVTAANDELDLSVTYTVTTPPSGGGGSGGGGGGGGGSSLFGTDLWDCGEWTECVDGKQTQECEQNSITKTNERECEEKKTTTASVDSGTEEGAAEEEVLSGPGSPPEEGDAEITGAAVGAKGSGVWIFLIVLVVLIAAALLLYFLKKKKGKFKPKSAVKPIAKPAAKNGNANAKKGATKKANVSKVNKKGKKR